MKMREKFCSKRYYIYARRNEKERWTDWTQSNEFIRALEHIKNIRQYGFFAKLYDKEAKEVIISD